MASLPILLFYLIFSALSAQAAETCEQEFQRISRDERNYSKREKSFREITEKCPAYAEAHNNLADALERLGRLKEAEKEYRLAAKLKPRFAIPLFGLGDVLLKQGRYPEAVSAYKRGLAIQPNDELAEKNLVKARANLPAGHPLQQMDASEIRRRLSRMNDKKTRGLGGKAIGGLAFHNIFFSFDSANLEPKSRIQLDEIAKALIPLIKERGLRFRVEGHTDASGNNSYNQRLSEGRASAVVDYLVRRHGLPRSRLKAVGYGKSRLADPARPGSGINRRVELAVD